MRWLLVVLALLPTVLGAQTPPQSTASSSAADGPSPGGADALPIPPKDAVPNCDPWFPWGHRVVGPTILSARITAAGEVSDASIALSSGDPQLDGGALACAKRMFVRPALNGTRPIEVRWQVAVYWPVGGHATYGVPSASGNECSYPDFAKRLDLSGVSQVHFNVEQDGSVSAVTLAASSGQPVLDKAALHCVGSRKFPPWHADLPLKRIASDMIMAWTLTGSEEGVVPERQLFPTFDSLKAEALSDRDCAAPQDYASYTVIVCTPWSTVWYFTKPNNDAHPAVIKEALLPGRRGFNSFRRYAFRRTWSFSLGTTTANLPEDKPEFKAWTSDIESVDEGIIARLSGKSSP